MALLHKKRCDRRLRLPQQVKVVIVGTNRGGTPRKPTFYARPNKNNQAMMANDTYFRGDMGNYGEDVPKGITSKQQNHHGEWYQWGNHPGGVERERERDPMPRVGHWDLSWRKIDGEDLSRKQHGNHGP